MSDVLINTIAAQQYLFRSRRVVTRDADRAVMVHSDVTVGTEQVRLYQTVNAGLSWTLLTIITGDFSYSTLGVWYSNWTKGNADDVLHVCWTHGSTGVGLYYRQIDMSGAGALNGGDLGTIRTVAAPGIDPPPGDHLYVTELENGDLYIFSADSTASSPSYRLYKSTNDGMGWSLVLSKDSADADMGHAGAHPLADCNSIVMLPGPGAFATETPWFFGYDEEAEEVFLSVWSETLDSFVSQTIESSVSGSDSGGGFRSQIAAVHRHSDDYVFFAFFTKRATEAGNELQSWRISDFGKAATRRGDILATPITGEACSVQLCVDQSLGHLYACYLRGTDNTSLMKAYWKRSINNGITWSAEMDSTEGAEDDLRWVDCPYSTDGLTQGRFHVLTWNDDTAEYRASDANTTVLGGFTVRSSADGGANQTTVACQIGQVLGVPNGVPLIPGQHPVSAESGLVSMAYASSAGSFSLGDPVKGLISGATGVFAGQYENPDRILIASVVPGPGADGTPFLPNETVYKVSDPTVMVSLSPTPVGTAAEVAHPPDNETT